MGDLDRAGMGRDFGADDLFPMGQQTRHGETPAFAGGPDALRHKLRGGFETAHPAPGLRIDSVLGHLVASGCGSMQSGPPRRQTPER